jgi:hypothetical protein
MVRASRFAGILFVFITAALGVRLPAAPTEPARSFPDPIAFVQKVRQAIRFDYELQSGFTYIEERRDVRISKLGKVEVGPLRTFEVHPSARPGRTYKRLIAIDGKPLPPEELARRDREHREHITSIEARERSESRGERAKRLKEEKESFAERNAILDDALAVYEPRFEGRDVIDGQSVFVMTLTPRTHARVRTREGRWMKNFEGRVWIAEADRQIAKVEMHAVDDVTIGWGILGRVHEGSRFAFERRWFDGAWLPAQVEFDASGRTLLFRKFDLDLVTTYSDYRRIQ